jgi:hypothetical protein
LGYTEQEITEAGLDDFRVFLRQVWDYLNLPPPTAVQNDMAYNLQHAPRRFILQAFRGIGKSWITVAYVCWRLFLNPQLKILVVSANDSLASDFTKFCLQLINGMPLLQHLAPRPGQKESALKFDVGPAHDSKDPSVKSAGINGQITGNRADIIIADDIEVPKNSYTHILREKLSELVKEFDAVLKPGGTVIYLGTPQAENSLYRRLIPRGYKTRIWPVEIPLKPESYGDNLAPFIVKMIERGAKPGTPVEPLRFPREEIEERRASYGYSGFALQFMLDTTPADAERHPLKTKDLIIHDIDSDVGHVKIVWGSAPEQTIQDLLSGGFDGDRYVRPAWKSLEMVPYQGTVMAIDPSGRGQDETAYAIVRYLNGMLYLVAVGGFTDGFGEETLRSLARLMIRHRVNTWVAEENYGGGMFAQLLKPYIAAEAEAARTRKENPDPNAAAARFDEEYDGWSSTNKEMRILDTLEPVMRQHRLVVDRSVIEAEMRQQQDRERYSFIYQMTRMARLKGCLANEDRLEAVSMAVGYWTERMARDKDKALDAHKESLLDDELRKFMDNAFHVGAIARPGQSGNLNWTTHRGKGRR